MEEHYILKFRKSGEGVEGEVLMRDWTSPGKATHLFEAPRQETPEELQAWAQQAIRAYREG
nr:MULTISPECIES: hypothetical protein [unclassified Paenibacillus]